MCWTGDVDEWQVHAGGRLLADHDCLTADAVESALAWAGSVVADEGVTVTGWLGSVANSRSPGSSPLAPRACCRG